MKRIVNWVVSLFRRGKTKYEVDEESYVAGAKEHFHRETTVDKLIVSEALRLREAARSYSVMVYTPEKRSASGFIISEEKEEEEVRFVPYYTSHKSTRNFHYMQDTTGNVVALVPKELCSTPRE